MRIPLIFNASPKAIYYRKNLVGVPFNTGKWRVVAENLKDSIIRIYHGSPTLFRSSVPLNGGQAMIEFKKPGVMAVRVISPGSEYSISIYAERLS